MSKRKTYKEFKQDLAFGNTFIDGPVYLALEIGEAFVKFGLIALPIVIGYVCLPLIALVLFLGITLALPIYVLYKMFKEAFVYGETQYAVLAFAIIALCLGFAEHQNYKNFKAMQPYLAEELKIEERKVNRIDFWKEASVAANIKHVGENIRYHKKLRKGMKREDKVTDYVEETFEYLNAYTQWITVLLDSQDTHWPKLRVLKDPLMERYNKVNKK